MLSLKPGWYEFVDHAALLTPRWLILVNQSIKTHFFTWLVSRCCRNSSVLLKQLLTKWLWCVTCGTGRLNTAGSHWEPQSRPLHRPSARAAHTQRDPDHSKNNWPASDPALEKLSASQQNKNREKAEAEYFALQSLLCWLGLCSSPWPIRSSSGYPKQSANVNHFLRGVLPGKSDLTATEVCMPAEWHWLLMQMLQIMTLKMIKTLWGSHTDL